jgi:hypothetical protein
LAGELSVADEQLIVGAHGEDDRRVLSPAWRGQRALRGLEALAKGAAPRLEIDARAVEHPDAFTGAALREATERHLAADRGHSVTIYEPRAPGALAMLAELRDALGFDAADAVACSSAAGQLVPLCFSEHMKNADSHVQDALDWADAVLGGGWRDQPPGPVRDRALAAIWALMHAGEAMLLDQSSLASGASVPTTVAHAYMEALSTQFAQTGALFDIAERIRFAPYLPVGHDRFFLTVPGNDL